MSNNQLNDRCIIFVDRVLNGEPKDRTKEDIRSFKPEGIVREGRFQTPCCEYMLENIDRFKEEYDGHLGLGFVQEGEDYFEDFTNCPFCGSPITYTIRKTFNMVQDHAGRWVKQEVH